MSLRGYIPKTRPAPWTQIRGKLKPKASKPKRIRSRSNGQQRRTAAYLCEARAFVVAEVAAGKACPVVAWAVKIVAKYNAAWLRFGTPIPARLQPLYDAATELCGFKYGHLISSRISQVHHKRGRLGPLLMDKRGWLGVSTQGHCWIDAHRELARQLGFLCQRGDWHRPFD